MHATICNLMTSSSCTCVRSVCVCVCVGGGGGFIGKHGSTMSVVLRSKTVELKNHSSALPSLFLLPLYYKYVRYCDDYDYWKVLSILLS